ncbi:MAG: phosphatase PAP2 family protein [Bacteriovorax sp.]|nr:phosphatase PAP2 family protein [Bacteriovorax sp.]
MKNFLSLLLIFFSLNVSADEQIIEGYSYKKPSILEPFTSMPHNFSDFFHESFSKDSLGPWALIASSTTLLYIYDQKISNETKRFGRRLHIGNQDHTKDMVKIAGVSVLRGPTDLGSTMYFFGDGWITLASTSAFLIVGNITNDYRALQTSSQLFSGLLMTGIITQAIKRSTGRESPIAATKERGRWQPFPSWSKFQGHISAYDAFPSGHLATAIMGVTVVAENYQEYTFIRPVGYTLASLLAFQMVNNDVHWISDYPLGIAIGYLVGKTASKNGRTKVNSENLEVPKTTYDFAPAIGNNGQLGLALNVSY